MSVSLDIPEVVLSLFWKSVRNVTFLQIFMLFRLHVIINKIVRKEDIFWKKYQKKEPLKVYVKIFFYLIRMFIFHAH
jgi:hypothetical protein